MAYVKTSQHNFFLTVQTDRGVQDSVEKRMLSSLMARIFYFSVDEKHGQVIFP